MSLKREYCFICGRIDKENDISLFLVPTGKLEDWQKQIRRPGLKKSSKLCEVHFEESDIDKVSVRRHLISKNVIPTKHLNTPDLNTPKRKRQPLKPTILNVGAPAGGPRVRSNAPPVKRPKSQLWPTSLAAAAVSTLFLDSSSPSCPTPGSQIECEAMDGPFISTMTKNHQHVQIGETNSTAPIPEECVADSVSVGPILAPIIEIPPVLSPPEIQISQHGQESSISDHDYRIDCNPPGCTAEALPTFEHHAAITQNRLIFGTSLDQAQIERTTGSTLDVGPMPGDVTFCQSTNVAFDTAATTQLEATPSFCGFGSTAPTASGQTPTTSAPAYNLSQTAATPSFGFGAQQATDASANSGQEDAGATSGFDTELQKAPTAFSFTPQSTATTSAPNTLSFCFKPAPTFRQPTLDFGAQQPTSSFPFGGAATTPVATSSGLPFIGQTSQPKGGLNFGQTPSTSTSSGGHNFVQASPAIDGGQPASTGRSFGATPTNSAGGLSFEQSAAATPSTAAAPTPSSTAAPTPSRAAAPTAFGFCQPSVTTPASSAPPAYSFNNTTPTSSSTGCSLTQPAASTAPAGSVFELSAPTTTAPPAFGASTGGLPSFGSTPTTSAGLPFGAPSPGSIPSATTPASSAPPAFQLGGTPAASSLGASSTSIAPTTSATPPPSLEFYIGISPSKTTAAATTVTANSASLSVTNLATPAMPSTVNQLLYTTTRNDVVESRLEVADINGSFSSSSAKNNQSFHKAMTSFTAPTANGSTDETVPADPGSVSNMDALPDPITIESSTVHHDQSTFISDSLHHNNCTSTGCINEDGTPSNIPQFTSTPKSKANKSKRVQVKRSRCGINSHSNCNGCNKFLSISARKKNSLLKKNPSGSCPKCFWYDQKLKQKSKIIKLQKQTIARLTSHIDNMAGKIAKFQEKLESLSEKSLERRISHLQPLGLNMKKEMISDPFKDKIFNHSTKLS